MTAERKYFPVRSLKPQRPKNLRLQVVSERFFVGQIRGAEQQLKVSASSE
jgi:hypothetical protein